MVGLITLIVIVLIGTTIVCGSGVTPINSNPTTFHSIILVSIKILLIIFTFIFSPYFKFFLL